MNPFEPCEGDALCCCDFCMIEMRTRVALRRYGSAGNWEHREVAVTIGGNGSGGSTGGGGSPGVIVVTSGTVLPKASNVPPGTSYRIAAAKTRKQPAPYSDPDAVLKREGEAYNEDPTDRECFEMALEYLTNGNRGPADSVVIDPIARYVDPDSPPAGLKRYAGDVAAEFANTKRHDERDEKNGKTLSKALANMHGSKVNHGLPLFDRYY